jgi:hypothetical protein
LLEFFDELGASFEIAWGFPCGVVVLVAFPFDQIFCYEASAWLADDALVYDFFNFKNDILFEFFFLKSWWILRY